MRILEARALIVFGITATHDEQDALEKRFLTLVGWWGYESLWKRREENHAYTIPLDSSAAAVVLSAVSEERL